MTLRMKLGLMVMIPLVGLAGQATAQDTHYWTEQYGNRARLLGGAMIGSASDLSAVYYNPGRLALATESEVLLAGNVVEYSSTKIGNPNSEKDLTSTRFSLSPSLFAGEMRFGWLGKSRLAFSFLTRNFSQFNTEGLIEAPLPGIDGRPDIDYLSGALRVDQRLSEYWGGITWAMPVSETFGVGVSTFIAVRNQRGLVQRTAQALLGGTPAVDAATREYDFDHWRALWKIGVGTKLEKWDVGLTITTPGLKLVGSGRVATDRSRVGVPGEEGQLSFIDQRDISSTYNSPWSVGVGGSRRFDRTNVHLGVEWFDGVALYDVLPGEPVAPVTGGDPSDPTIRHESGSVINAAAGVAHTFNEKWQGFASLRTDFSSALDETRSNLALTRWNLYHFAVGGTLHGDSTEFTTGAVFAFGSSEAPTNVSVTPLESSYFRVTIVLGFSFGFADVPAAQ